MPDPDYYAVLRVSPDATPEAIQSAYRGLSKQYHPDLGQPGASAAKMQAINEAYRVLSDEKARREYDKGLGPQGRTRQERSGSLRQGDLNLELGPDLTLPLARVPGGAFILGGCTPQACLGRETACRGERYSFDLPTFFIGIYPVTVAQYARFAFLTRRRRTPWARRAFSFDPAELDDPDTITRLDRNWQQPFGAHSSVAGKEDHPVMIVTWHDSVAFCRWASEVSGAQVRLPTAAEWQKAARGTEGRCFPWGDCPAPDPRLCNCRSDGAAAGRRPGDTTPVGAHSPAGDSPYGCADMLGNVWEWTSTHTRDRDGNVRFDPPYRADDGREEPGGRDFRLLLGGSFESQGRSLCCAAGMDQDPLRARDTGFRVCVSAK